MKTVVERSDVDGNHGPNPSPAASFFGPIDPVKQNKGSI